MNTYWKFWISGSHFPSPFSRINWYHLLTIYVCLALKNHTVLLIAVDHFFLRFGESEYSSVRGELPVFTFLSVVHYVFVISTTPFLSFFLSSMVLLSPRLTLLILMPMTQLQIYLLSSSLNHRLKLLPKLNIALSTADIADPERISDLGRRNLFKL